MKQKEKVDLDQQEKINFLVFTFIRKYCIM